MPQTATIKSLPEAFEVVKAMQTDGLDWGEGYRPLGRRALAEMGGWPRMSIGGSATSTAPQRRLSPQLAERAIELKVPRTRRYCPVSVIRSYARRAPEIDRAILTGFVPGLSTRKVGETFCSAARLRRQPSAGSPRPWTRQSRLSIAARLATRP